MNRLFEGFAAPAGEMGPKGKEIRDRIYRGLHIDVPLDPEAMQDIMERAADHDVSLNCEWCDEPLCELAVTATSIGSTCANASLRPDELIWLKVDKDGEHYSTTRNSAMCFSCMLLDLVRQRLRGGDGARAGGDSEAVPADSLISSIQEKYSKDLTPKMCRKFKAERDAMMRERRRDARAEAAGLTSRFAHRDAQLDALAKAAGLTRSEYKAAQLDALAAAEGLTRFAHRDALLDALAKAAGYTDRMERKRAEHQIPSNCWIYRVVHDPGVAIRRTPDSNKGDEGGNLTGENVLFGTLVGVVERRPCSDGMTYLKLGESECFEGWVFERSPDGTECLKLVREAK
jgi:hypothetical protein